MNNPIKITQSKKETIKIKSFEKDEWLLADMEHYGKPRDFVKKRYKFIAKNKTGGIAGVLYLTIEANISFLEGLLVGHQHRRKGIGTELLLFAEKLAKDNKCTKIWTETDEDWEATLFYKKMGFEICGVHENHYLGKKGLVLTKFL